jgi:hypothetical protein
VYVCLFLHSYAFVCISVYSCITFVYSIITAPDDVDQTAHAAPEGGKEATFKIL